MLDFSLIEGEFLLFLSCTNEKKNAARKIFQHFEPNAQVLTNIKLLDVGCGSGEISIKIIKLMGKPENVNITLVEPNSHQLNIAKVRMEKSGIHSMTCIQKKIEDSKEFEDYTPGFDLIIASHLFDYVSDIQEVLKQLYSALSPNGQLCIILSTPTSDVVTIRSILLDYLGKKEPDEVLSEDLLVYVKKFGWQYEIEDVSSSIKFPLSNRNTLFGITRFIGHLPPTSLQPDLIKKISMIYSLKSNTGLVRLISKEKIIWISRP